MKVEKQLDGSWLATGRGPVRPIAVEAETCISAMRAFVAVCDQQQKTPLATAGKLSV